ncbi:putative histone-lysine N-methyltransferase 1 [Hydra vulgaris]|uniref:Histone-lysine N-methyltransferase 1 n=1 Tax=Hydra vulgaris TaxID=6087 RepID=A0ABM4CMH4_HYDVU
MSEVNIASFNEQLSLLHWNHINFSSEANVVYNSFFRTFYEVYDANFPQYKVNLNKKSLKSPWITEELRKSSQVKIVSQLFESQKKNLKKKYYSNLLEKFKNNAKRTWQILNEITGNQKIKTCNLPKFIKNNDDFLYNPKDIANQINNLFVTIGPNLEKNIPIITNTINDLNLPIISILNNFELSIKEFECAYKMLKINKSIGPDQINGNVFSCSIKQGIFPDQLKIAKVTPIFKGGELSNITNYRPISVLSDFSKIYERILYNKIYDHLSKNKILSTTQYGFKKHNSTEHAVLHLTRNIADSFEKSQFILAVFIDLSKAFDTINHEIFIKKTKKLWNLCLRNDLCVNEIDCESLCIELKSKNTKNIIVNATYRPPSGNLKKYKTHLKSFITAINKTRDHVFLAGDLNIDLKKHASNNNVKNFINTLLQSNLIPTINKPTRVTNNSSRLLDNIVTNNFHNNRLNTGIIKTDLSDHFPTFLVTNNIINNNIPSKTTIFRRQINENSVKQFQNLLRNNVDWNLVLQSNDANNSYDLFLSQFCKQYETAFPEKQIIVNTKIVMTPWMSNG